PVEAVEPAFAQLPVGRVHARIGHADRYFAIGWLGRGNVGDAHHLPPSETVDRYGPHARPPERFAFAKRSVCLTFAGTGGMSRLQPADLAMKRRRREMLKTGKLLRKKQLSATGAVAHSPIRPGRYQSRCVFTPNSRRCCAGARL